MTSAETDFHTHLDNCEQCRNKPFELCPIGRALAGAALKELESFIAPAPKPKDKS
jgi:hypothetical protein